MRFWVPPGLVHLVRRLRFTAANRRALSLAAGNKRFRNRHKGQRCFILCNGPSVNRQNLLVLRGEIIFSVSSGYLHKDYPVYQPSYHCTPPLTYTDRITTERAIAWFREMHERVGQTEVFHSHQEERLIRENGLFPGRRINYLCMHGALDPASMTMPDIARLVPGVLSVPIMCLYIAMYMGFKDIYLIGTEHDSFRTREYKYFFEPTVLKGVSGGVDEEDRVTDPVCDELYVYYMLFSQYRALKRIAGMHGIRIYNATIGGALEEFPRVALEDVFK